MDRPHSDAGRCVVRPVERVTVRRISEPYQLPPIPRGGCDELDRMAAMMDLADMALASANVELADAIAGLATNPPRR